MKRSAAVAAVFEPVSPLTTFEETVARLGTAIRVGLLAPSTQLPSERDLAAQLGISRSTLRQAITTLVQSGLLESQRGRGGGTFVVSEPPLSAGPGVPLDHEARNVLDHRVAIETGCAVLAAERRRPEDLDAMMTYVDRMAGALDFDEYRRGDIRFHIGLAEATRSAFLVGVMTEVQGQMSELIVHIAHPELLLTHSNAQHRRLVTLLERRDGAAAVALLREHLEGTEHILEGLMPPAAAT